MLIFKGACLKKKLSILIYSNEQFKIFETLEEIKFTFSKLIKINLNKIISDQRLSPGMYNSNCEIW